MVLIKNYQKTSNSLFHFSIWRRWIDIKATFQDSSSPLETLMEAPPASHYRTLGSQRWATRRRRSLMAARSRVSTLISLSSCWTRARARAIAFSNTHTTRCTTPIAIVSVRLKLLMGYVIIIFYQKSLIISKITWEKLIIRVHCCPVILTEKYSTYYGSFII